MSEDKSNKLEKVTSNLPQQEVAPPDISERVLNPHEYSLRPPTEAEVVMDAAKDIMHEISVMRQAEVASQERTETLRITLRHDEVKVSKAQAHAERKWVIWGVLFIGGAGSGLAFWFQRPDFGITILLSTITGILGLLAGGIKPGSGGTDE